MNEMLFVYSMLDWAMCIIHPPWRDRQESRTCLVGRVKERRLVRTFVGIPAVKTQYFTLFSSKSWFPYQKVQLRQHAKIQMWCLFWLEWSSVCFRKLIMFLCSHLSPERRFSAGTQRCGGGCRRACGAGVFASTWPSGAYRVLETQQRANQQQGRTYRCEFIWVFPQRKKEKELQKS